MLGAIRAQVRGVVVLFNFASVAVTRADGINLRPIAHVRASQRGYNVEDALVLGANNYR